MLVVITQVRVKDSRKGAVLHETKCKHYTNGGFLGQWERKTANLNCYW